MIFLTRHHLLHQQLKSPYLHERDEQEEDVGISTELLEEELG